VYGYKLVAVCKGPQSDICKKNLDGCTKNFDHYLDKPNLQELENMTEIQLHITVFG